MPISTPKIPVLTQSKGAILKSTGFLTRSGLGFFLAPLVHILNQFNLPPNQMGAFSKGSDCFLY